MFNDPYIPQVNDNDSGKNGVFSLSLVGNNGTFEISPTVAERHAQFIIKVRDNTMLDFEARKSVVFQVNILWFLLNLFYIMALSLIIKTFNLYKIFYNSQLLPLLITYKWEICERCIHNKKMLFILDFSSRAWPCNESVSDSERDSISERRQR